MSDSLQPHRRVHGILQARILEWGALPSSRGSSQPRDPAPGLLHCRQLVYHLSHQTKARDGVVSRQLFAASGLPGVRFCVQLSLVPSTCWKASQGLRALSEEASACSMPFKVHQPLSNKSSVSPVDPSSPRPAGSGVLSLRCSRKISIVLKPGGQDTGTMWPCTAQGCSETVSCSVQGTRDCSRSPGH